MLWVSGGTFTMGGADDEAVVWEKPLRSITLPSFCMARFPVTQTLYAAIMDGANPSHFRGEDRPVEHVSWDEAQQFIQVLNEKTGRTQAKWRYCLPSEAQWEYAAHGGEAGAKQGFKYAGSNKLKEVGWFDTNSHNETKPVRLKLPNVLGLYDMSGNVWEWCEDDSHYSYENAQKNDGAAWVDTPERGSRRVFRGGSWRNTPWYCRVASRDDWQPEFRLFYIGFRLCLASSEVGD
jgi:formylglycine-generating enzyme required for sulfatase activity